ncbi:thioesterase-like superfamily-domain-containing protein [Poronia punctata]|nr:thioesterase-like superfamily-domain-containing protein [Poronia punctata]
MPPRLRIPQGLHPGTTIRGLQATTNVSRSACAYASTQTSLSDNSADTSTSSIQLPPSRWISDIRARIGKCLSFGCDVSQVRRASEILRVLANEWLSLSARSEGFLTGKMRGLESQQVVWGEMDSFGHVNNTVYNRYAESARVNWILHFAREQPKLSDRWSSLMTPNHVGLIMKSIKADFKFPMTAPDKVSAYHRLSIRPEAEHTSLFLDCAIYSHRHRRVAARTAEEVTIYDYRKASKTTLPDFALETLQDLWEKQQQQAVWARERIWTLLDEVERLEKDTWNRADAVEDLGVAGSAK